MKFDWNMRFSFKANKGQRWRVCNATQGQNIPLAYDIWRHSHSIVDQLYRFAFKARLSQRHPVFLVDDKVVRIPGTRVSQTTEPKGRDEEGVLQTLTVHLSLVGFVTCEAQLRFMGESTPMEL